jgi:hypothetical protein
MVTRSLIRANLVLIRAKIAVHQRLPPKVIAYGEGELSFCLPSHLPPLVGWTASSFHASTEKEIEEQKREVFF